ncbi:hypothetical protein DV737_g5330, partial [Chaetothyriales sp. CBS 132003]
MPKSVFLNSRMQSLLERGRAYLGPTASSQKATADGFTTVKAETGLFPKVDAKVDGDECLHDCASCTIAYPKKFSIDEGDKLYGHVNGWDTHLIVGTGKTDWVRDVADEKGSVMRALDKYGLEYERSQGRGTAKLRLSASNMPTGSQGGDSDTDEGSNCLLLPSWQLIEHVRPGEVAELMREVVEPSVTNKTPLQRQGSKASPTDDTTEAEADLSALTLTASNGNNNNTPLLRSEFERHLRPLGLYRDLHDERPGGVGIYFINHVGGHKTSQAEDGQEYAEAAQGIWLARVRPADCENIVRYTVLQGKVVKPESQLRGGFDRERALLSW